jgi:hypothetical protein
MLQRRIFAVTIAALLFAVLSSSALRPAAAEQKKEDAGAKEEPLACERHWGEARNTGYGYSHIVHIANGCLKDIVCKVSTDVNPEVTTVNVPAGREVEVNTFYSSPYSAFTPRVSCTLVDAPKK